jgi:hypothetical protein
MTAMKIDITFWIVAAVLVMFETALIAISIWGAAELYEKVPH